MCLRAVLLLLHNDFFSVAECETIEVFHAKPLQEYKSEGLYTRADDRAFARTKNSTWRHLEFHTSLNKSERIIFYDGSAKEWRLGYKEQQNTEDYLFSSNTPVLFALPPRMFGMGGLFMK